MKEVKKLKKELIEQCREIYNKKVINKSNFAKSIALSPSTIKDFFDGKSNTKVLTVIKILNALGCELKIKNSK